MAPEPTYGEAYDAYLALLREGEALGLHTGALGAHISTRLEPGHLRALLRYHYTYRDRKTTQETT
jgi:hypothetical protein